MKIKVILLFYTIFLTSLYANIGKVSFFVGDVSVSRDEHEIHVTQDMIIYPQDTITTIDNSKVQIIFRDNTVVTIGENSALSIIDYFYDKSRKKDSKINLSFFKGKFKVKTGAIANINEENFKVCTKSANIEIKGTQIIGNQDIIVSSKGVTSVSALEKTIILNANEFTRTSSIQLPTKAQETTPEILDLLKIDIDSNIDPIKEKNIQRKKTFYWGDSLKIDITKDEVENIIKEYVDKKQPQKVKEYEAKLKKEKQSKIEIYSTDTFVNGDLMWQDNKALLSKNLNILESKIYCRKLTLAKKKDWRVPTYDELFTLVDYNKHKPSSLDKIKYMQPLKYWSITPNIKDTKKYWYIDFSEGLTQNESKMQRNKIRCVRDISKKVGEY